MFFSLGTPEEEKMTNPEQKTKSPSWRLIESGEEDFLPRRGYSSGSPGGPPERKPG